MNEEIKELIKKAEDLLENYELSNSRATSLLAIAKILAIALEKGE